MLTDRTCMPTGWTVVNLGETCDIVQGQSPPGETYNTEGAGLPFLQGKGEFGDISPTAVKWCSAPTKIAEPDDVLISVRAPVGPTNLCSVQSCIGRGLAAVRPYGNIPPRFVLYGLRASEAGLRAKATGTTFEAIRGEDLRTHPLPLPPLAEQYRIVAEIEKQLTRLDASVAALRRARANLKRYRASVLKDACEGRLVPTEASLARAEGREYEPAGQLLQRILEERRARWESQEKRRGTYKEPATPDTSALPELPEGWVWASGEQLAATIRNGLSQKPEGAQGTPILRISAVRPLAVDLEDVRWIADGRNFNDYRIAEGDLLFTRYNGNPALVGTCGLVRSVARDTLHPDKLIRVTLIESSVMPKFIQVVANVGSSRQFLSTRTRTTAGQSGISGLDLKQMPLPLPPLAEQDRIVVEVERGLSVVQQAEAILDVSLRRAERLRQSVLKRAFEGKLVTQDPNDEPASVLLERIRAARDAAEASETRRRAGRRGRGSASKREEQA